MKRISVVIVACLLYLENSIFSQSIHGEIIYVQTNSWAKINAGLSYLSQEEKDRIIYTYGKSSSYKERMKLTINDSISYYTYVLDDKSDDFNWSFKKAEYQIYRNFALRKTFDRIGLLGKTYIIKDEIPKQKWKIRGEIKEVAGYVCMKAETSDTIKNQKITAWFTDKILAPIGPGEFGGLPGVILEININDGASSIIAESINLDSTPMILPPKSKGKVINYSTYRDLINTYIHDCIERKRNPYWDLRY